jgi:hypothetical protein
MDLTLDERDVPHSRNADFRNVHLESELRLNWIRRLRLAKRNHCFTADYWQPFIGGTNVGSYH